MAIDNMMFALHVAEQQNKLIKNLKDKGIELPKDTSLASAIDNTKKLDKQTYQPSPEEGWEVIYYDIDGTILKEERLRSGEIPNPPVASYDNDRLTFDGWADLPEKANGPIYALATYVTTTDETYIDISVGTSLSYTLVNFTNKSTDFSVDWGDGTVDTSTTHTYTEEGEYTIKITGTFTHKNCIITNPSTIKKLYYAKNISVVSDHNQTGIFVGCSNLEVIVMPSIYCRAGAHTNKSGPSKLKTFYAKDFLTDQHLFMYFLSVIKICGGICLYHGNSLSRVPTLKYLSINGTYNWTSGSDSTILPSLKYLKITGDCYFSVPASYAEYIEIAENITKLQIGGTKIPVFTLPPNLTILSLHGGQIWDKIELPESLITLSLSGFNRIEELIIPDNVEGTLPSLSDNYILKKLVISNKINKITYINNSSYSVGLEELVYKPSTVLSVNTFKMASNGVIWVNDDIIEDLKVATNWSAHADKMRPLSEKPID